MHIPHNVYLPSNSTTPSQESANQDSENEIKEDADTNHEDPSSSSHHTLIIDSIDPDINCVTADSILHATSWTNKLIRRYAHSSFPQPIRTSSTQMLNWTWINEILWPNGVFPDDPIVDMVRCTDEDLAYSLSTALDSEDIKAISLEEENHLLSLTNPSRISPKIFLQLPGAIAAICDEINMLLSPDSNKIPGQVVVDYKKRGV